MTELPCLGPGEETFSEAGLRAGTYSLLANLLSSPPREEMLHRLGLIESGYAGEPNELAVAWANLKLTAEHASVASIDDEYHALFIGLGRGEIVPYGSWYLTGYLMEKPLGELRRDLAMLGYERAEDAREPEDHAAALCEVMAMLITDDSVSFDAQRKFFKTYLDSWIEKFFSDLEEAKSAHFYRAVGRLGREFVKLDKRYLSMLV